MFDVISERNAKDILDLPHQVLARVWTKRQLKVFPKKRPGFVEHTRRKFVFNRQK